MFLNNIGQHSAAPAFSRHSAKILGKMHAIKHSNNDLKFHLQEANQLNILQTKGLNLKQPGNN